MHVDLHFPALGESLDSDHGYDLYAALAGLVPRLHEESCKIRIGPMRGSYTGNGSLRLDSRFSRLRLRLAAEEIPPVLQLAGKAIDVGGNRLRLGVPQVRNLEPRAKRGRSAGDHQRLHGTWAVSRSGPTPTNSSRYHGQTRHSTSD